MVKVKFECVLADWWGMDDLLKDLQGWTAEDIRQEIIDLINEDISAVLEDGTWSIEIVDEPNYQPAEGVTGD